MTQDTSPTPPLQSWKKLSSSKSNVCRDISQLLRSYKSLRTCPEGLTLSKALCKAMPIWYHINADPIVRRLSHSRGAKCLLSKHKVVYASETCKLYNVTSLPLHRDSVECECRGCMYLEIGKDCQHPNECTKLARRLLDALPAKWDPRMAPDTSRGNSPDLGVDLNAELLHINSIPITSKLSDVFCIFMSGPNITEIHKAPLPVCPTMLRDVYVHVGKGVASSPAIAGLRVAYAGVVFSGRDDLNCSEVWSSSNDFSELSGILLAMLLGVLRGGKQHDLRFNIRIPGVWKLFSQMGLLEDLDFMGSRDASILRVLLGRLRMCRTKIWLSDASDKPPREEEERAKLLAVTAVAVKEVLFITPLIPPELHLTELSCKH